jgi:hypothetical protein
MIMKNTLCLLTLLVAGCVTYEVVPSPKPRPYFPHELSLNLSQDNNFDILLELRNETLSSITNQFPQTIFEGKFYFIQAGCIPGEVYPGEYLDLVLHALWGNPPYVLEPGASLIYRIPLNTLVPISPSYSPKIDKTLLVYAHMERGFDITSNAIELKQYEQVDWRTNSWTTTTQPALRTD